MERAHAMAHFDDWLTDRTIRLAELETFVADLTQVGEAFRDGYAIWTSSGTSGTPGLFIHDRVALARYDALELVRCNWPSWPILPRWTPWWPHRPWPWPVPSDRYAVVCMTGGHFATLASVERMRRSLPWLSSSLRAFDGMLPLPQLSAQLQAFDPHWLAGYPSSADLLADVQRSGQLSLHLKGLWTGGETLEHSTRIRIEQSFNCRVRDDYGASEFLPIAWECLEGNLHVNEDWVILEPVDQNLRAVAPGKASHSVLLTNLANHLQPLVRYNLGDRVTPLGRNCACGSSFLTIRVEGRDDDILELETAQCERVRLSPLALVTALEDLAHVHAFQLIRCAPSALELRVDPQREHPDALQRGAATLRQWLCGQGLSNIEIHPLALAPACHPRSGKLRRVLARPLGSVTTPRGHAV